MKRIDTAGTRSTTSRIVRTLGALVPPGLAAHGLWILFTGSASYRPGRGDRTRTLLPPDAWLAGLFFVFLAMLVASLGMSGRKEAWLFRVGLGGSLFCLVTEGARQLLGIAAYGTPY